MPELPDVDLYLEALRPRVVGQPLLCAKLHSAFLLRTHEPPLSSAEGRAVSGLRRLGKRIVLELQDGLFLVFHLMIAGRFAWQTKPPPARPPRTVLAAFEFPTGHLVLTETSSRKRASLHLLRGEAALAALDPGGLEVLDCDLATFAAALRRENHTLKRALTDPRLLSGIGNAYSDEILAAAGLSPFKLTGQLTDAEVARLLAATVETLTTWTARLRTELAGRFPEPRQVTAFRDDFAVHHRFGQPCGHCGTAVQRVVYADTEMHYCPRCQTGGKILADRSLSRLLRDDWPKTIEELEGG